MITQNMLQQLFQNTQTEQTFTHTNATPQELFSEDK